MYQSTRSGGRRRPTDALIQSLMKKPDPNNAKADGHSDKEEEAEKDSHDSGLGDGANFIPTTTSSGDAAILGLKGMASAVGRGAPPLPATMPSMATLRSLTNDLEKYSKMMFDELETTSISIYDMVLKGFKDTGGKCRSFIHEMGALAIMFFAQAKEMEGGLAKCDAAAFAEAMDASKDHVFHLISEVAEAEGIYDKGEAHFNKILELTAEQVRQFIALQGVVQRKVYKAKCLDRIEQDHGRLDGASFVPMIIGNLTAHRALAMSLRVSQSQVPLQITLAPLRTQSGAVKIYMKFVEFLARRVIALQEKLGPGITSVPLKSEPNDQSMSPITKTPPPSRHSSPAPSKSRQGSLARKDPSNKALMPATGKSVFSPQSQNAMSLWDNMSEDNMGDSCSEVEEKQAPTKCQHGSSNEEARSPSKKPKVDVSKLYDPDTDGKKKKEGDGTTKKDGDGATSKEGDGTTNKDKSEKSEGSKPKKTKKHKKHSKHKKHGKDREKEKEKQKENKEKPNVKMPEKASGDKKMKAPAPKTPKKAKPDKSEGGNSDMPVTPKSKKKLAPVRSVAECRVDKWANDLETTIRYCQQMNISVHHLPEGRNYSDHTDYV